MPLRDRSGRLAHAAVHRLGRSHASADGVMSCQWILRLEGAAEAPR
jgi:hypothetical protein